MELLLTSLPTILCYLTGMLIAWSAVTSYNAFKIFCFLKTHKKKLRKIDIAEFSLLVGSAVLLGVSLFLFPSFFLAHASTIFVLELWYSFFLYCVTEKTVKSLNQILLVERNELHPSYLPGEHTTYTETHSEFIHDLMGKCGKQ